MMSGFEFLEGHMKMIYGNRGDFKHNLERYISSELFQNASRVPKTINDIPIVDFEQLKGLCYREKYYNDLSRKIVAEYDSLSKQKSITKDDYLEWGGVLGVCPWIKPETEVLYPYLLDLFVKSNDEGEKIWKEVQNQMPILQMIVDNLVCSMRDGQIYNYKGRMVWSQGYIRNFFRGENAYYSKSRPSMFRGEPARHGERESSRLANALRTAELALWMRSLECINGWQYSDIFDSAIAQHYGIPTSHMDISGNIMVALFFACCKWDGTGWKPLNTLDFKYADSRKSVYELGGDSRYGVLFVAPAIISRMSGILNDDYFNLTEVEPIGYQPFIRCSAQNGFIIRGNPEYDMFCDPAFAKVRFRLTQEICDWIYDEMDCGNKIYPKEPFVDISRVVSRIKTTKRFSKQAFEKLMDSWEKSEGECKVQLEKLNEYGYCIEEKPIEWCDSSEKKNIEKALKSQMEQIENNYPKMAYFKPVFAI